VEVSGLLQAWTAEGREFQILCSIAVQVEIYDHAGGNYLAI